MKGILKHLKYDFAFTDHILHFNPEGFGEMRDVIMHGFMISHCRYLFVF